MVSFNDNVEKIPPTHFLFYDEFEDLWYSKQDFLYYRRDCIVDLHGLLHNILVKTNYINLEIIKRINYTNISETELRLLLLVMFDTDFSFDIIVEEYLFLTGDKLF